MRNGLFIAVACLLVSIVFAATEPLNVKTGLWQVSEISTTSGLPPLPPGMQARLDKMTPEQRAKMEAAMKGRAGGTPQTINYKTCVTKDDLDKGAFTRPDEKCSWTVVNSSRTDLEVRGSACEAGKSEGMKTDVTMKIHVIDSENVKGAVQGSATGNGNTLNIDNTYTGKWVSATCPADKN